MENAQHPRPQPTENRFAERDRVVCELIGLTLDQANRRVRAAKNTMLTLQVVNGDHMTADLNRMRINVRLFNGVVVSATIG